MRARRGGVGPRLAERLGVVAGGGAGAPATTLKSAENVEVLAARPRRAGGPGWDRRRRPRPRTPARRCSAAWRRSRITFRSTSAPCDRAGGAPVRTSPAVTTSTAASRARNPRKGLIGVSLARAGARNGTSRAAMRGSSPGEAAGMGWRRRSPAARPDRRTCCPSVFSILGGRIDPSRWISTMMKRLLDRRLRRPLALPLLLDLLEHLPQVPRVREVRDVRGRGCPRRSPTPWPGRRAEAGPGAPPPDRRRAGGWEAARAVAADRRAWTAAAPPCPRAGAGPPAATAAAGAPAGCSEAGTGSRAARLAGRRLGKLDLAASAGTTAGRVGRVGTRLARRRADGGHRGHEVHHVGLRGLPAAPHHQAATPPSRTTWPMAETVSAATGSARSRERRGSGAGATARASPRASARDSSPRRAALSVPSWAR